jgi:hypothetical protein
MYKTFGLMDGSEKAKHRLEYFRTTEQAAATQKHGPNCDHHFHPSRGKKAQTLNESHQRGGKGNHVDKREGERKEGGGFIIHRAGCRFSSET